MKIFSYKKAGLLLIVLGLFSSPSYAWLGKLFQSCSEKYQDNIARALSVADISCAKELINEGADVNIKSSERTPLIWAVLQGNKDIVSLLIEKKANPFIVVSPALEIYSIVDKLLGVEWTAKDHAYSFSREWILTNNLAGLRFSYGGIANDGALYKQRKIELERELADGVDFDDPKREEIYNMLVQYEASYRN